MRALVSILITFVALGCSNHELGVDRIDPKLGVTRGGEKVTIYGSGFEDKSPITVYFGDHRAKYTSTKGPGRLWVSTPEVDGPGKVDVRLITGDGRQYLIKDGFECVKKNEMAECVNISRALNGNQAD